MKINNPSRVIFTTFLDVTGSRAINATVYQNTSIYPRMVTVTMTMNTNGDNIVQFAIGATAAPNSLVGEWGGNVLLTAQSYGSVTFMVPGLWYYKGTQSGTVTILAWVENV